MPDLFGRSDDEWDRLASSGEEFLIEVARCERLTTYTELNDELVRRTGERRFDFSLQSDRNAVGHLLFLIVNVNRPTTGLMISALVRYIDLNDAGSGFYNFAADLGLLPRSAGKELRDQFWANQVSRLHALYAGPPVGRRVEESGVPDAI